MNKLRPFIDSSNAYMDLRRKVIELAYNSFIQLFESLAIHHIDIGNYADEFYVMCNDGGTGDNEVNVNVHVSSVEYEPGYGLYLIDDYGTQWESSQWCQSMEIVFNLAVQCLDDKYEDYHNIKKGCIVRWIDPAIDDYDPDDRAEQLEMLWVVDDCPETDELADDTIISISNEYGEAEVLLYELVYVRDK